MFIEERIVALLVPVTLTGLYPQTAPDKTPTPYVTYGVMNNQNLTTHTAPLPSTRMWTFQFNVYSPTRGEARTIGTAIETALVGYTDAYIFGVTPQRAHDSWDDIAKLFCWIVELLVTENSG